MDDEEPRPLAQRGKLGRRRRMDTRAKADPQAGGRNDLAYPRAEPPDDWLGRWRFEISSEDIKELVEGSPDRSTRQHDMSEFVHRDEGMPSAVCGHV